MMSNLSADSLGKPPPNYPGRDAMLATLGDLQKVSFVRWLRAVREVGLDQLDEHSRLQTTEAEYYQKGKYGTVCKLEQDLAACLGGVNQHLGTNFSLDKARHPEWR